MNGLTLGVWRVEVWIGRSDDPGSFMGQPTMTLGAVAAYTKAQAERRARKEASSAVSHGEPFTVVAKAHRVGG